MPKLAVNGTQIHYEEKGTGDPVVLVHGLAFDGRMWEHQVETLSRSYRTINVNLRGHGGSASPDMEYDLDMMTEDVHQVMGKLGTGQAHLVGFSMGGMIVMRMALADMRAVRSLALVDTSAAPEIPDRAPGYEVMARTVRQEGPQNLVDPMMSIFFSANFLQGQPDEAKKERDRLLKLDRIGTSNATYAVTRRKDITDRLHEIKVPTLVIVGGLDTATPVEKSRAIQSGIPGSRLEIIPGTGHMSPIEKPAEVSRLIVDFLNSVR
jgi:3-oxoadipate enol-lactonase